jgi:hypothetical protein
MEAYFDELTERFNRDCNLPYDLVYYFNEFAVYYLPRQKMTEAASGIETIRKYGQAIVEFWNWLKVHRLTEVQL